ncbi:MAG TPA: aldo/keto reductase [Prolixibacteraceae bacterium]|nr:aldo/keto reductase [Prolixibacteraceae bacterium]
MEYRKLGQSDLNLSVVTFGAWAAGGWMWGGTERSEAVKAIRAGFDYGMTSIDTAPAYGQGTSEEIVREAIKGIPRDQVQILTKFGLSWEGTKGQFFFSSKNNQGKPIEIYRYSGKESIIRECETSLRLLGTDYIDLYQIHWADPTTPVQETMEAVAQLIQEGKVRYAGVCNYDVDQMKEAAKYIELVSDQVPYSMVKRDIEQELIPYLIENNQSVLAYSPLQRGLLSGKIRPDHQFSEGDTRADLTHYSAKNIQLTNAFLVKLKPLADEKKATLSQLVIRWTLGQPGITIALVGARNASQAAENAQAFHVKLSAEEVSFISTELDKLHLEL